MPVNDQTPNVTIDNSSVHLIGTAVPVSGTYISAQNLSGSLTGLRSGTSGSLIAQTYGWAIGAHEVSGAISTVYAQGTIASTSETAVRLTTYNEQTTNGQRSVKSTSASDTVAGTGARRVKIVYYDETGDGPFSEIVNLNGTSAVATTNTNICYIDRFEVAEFGSGGASVGAITLHSDSSGGGTTIVTLSIGHTRAALGLFYYKNGEKALISNLSCATVTAGRLSFRFKDMFNSGSNITNESSVITVRTIPNTGTTVQFEPPIPGPTGSFYRVQIYWGGDAGTSTVVGASYSYTLVR